MINDLNNGTVAWTDGNILLDETGGPNHVGNFCFAPVHADTRTGELIYTPSYYYIGHLSKFISPGARKVSTSSSRSPLLSTSFLNTDGKMATIVMNQSDRKITYKLYVGSRAPGRRDSYPGPCHPDSGILTAVYRGITLFYVLFNLFPVSSPE